MKEKPIIIVILLYILIPINTVYATDKNVICENYSCSGFGNSLFSETAVVPGETITRSFSISNHDPEPINIDLVTAEKPNSDVDFVEIVNLNMTQNNSVDLFVGSMAGFLNNNIPLGSVSSGNTQTYEIAIQLPPEAGNDFQAKSANFSLSLHITGGPSGQNVLGTSDEITETDEVAENQSSIVGKVLGLSDTYGSTRYKTFTITGIIMMIVGLLIISKPKKLRMPD